MLQISVEGHRVRIGERFSVSFQRTLRIPDDGRAYPLPPGLGAFPVQRVADHRERVPPAWLEQESVLIPMYQREALWLGFDGAAWKPNAVKIGAGGVNAVSGSPWDTSLHADPQDYVVCPDQPWLDGINAGNGVVRQFVAVPLGLGYTIEAQVTGIETTGGIQVVVFEPKPGRFPDEPPPEPEDMLVMEAALEAPAGMGLAAGGRIEQKIYPDDYGIDAWDPDNRGDLFVHIVNSEQYRELTGEEPPPSPITARTYTDYGFPWFRLYDEDRANLPAGERLAGVKSVKELDEQRGLPVGREEGTVEIDPRQITRLRPEERGKRPIHDPPAG